MSACTKPCRFTFRHPGARPAPRCAISEAEHLKRLEHACVICAAVSEVELRAEAERVRTASRCAAACEFPELHPGEHAPCDLVAGHDARGALLFHTCAACSKRGVDDCIEAARSAKERVRGSLTDATAAPSAEESDMPPRKKSQAPPPVEPAAPAPVASAIEQVALAELHEHPRNTRRRFVESEISELAASIREVGIIQPLVVRPRAEGGRELVCGAKRFRAATVAGLTHVPCAVRELSDEQVLVLMLAENKHRSGVHPLEEAEGFGRLRDEFKRTVEEISVQTATPLRTVYQRLRYLSLGEEARAAFYDNRITARVALLLAAIADQEEQAKALAEVLPREDGFQFDFEQAKRRIEAHYWRELSDAPWDLGDAKLHAQAGPCNGCPFRTGHQPHLFDGADESDQCTKPACFDVKRAKWGMVRLSSARDEGLELIEGDAAAKLFPQGNRPVWTSGYTTLDDWPSSLNLREDLRNQRWREVFGAANAPKPVAIAQVPSTGDVVELHRREDLEKEARRRGLVEEVKAAPPKRESAEERKARIADEKRRKARDEARRKVVSEILNQTLHGDVEIAVARAVGRRLTDPNRFTHTYEPLLGLDDELLAHLGPTPPKRKNETADDALHRASAEWGALELLALMAVSIAVEGGNDGVEDALVDGDIASACGLTLRDFLPPAEETEEPKAKRKKRSRGKAAAAGEEE